MMPDAYEQGEQEQREHMSHANISNAEVWLGVTTHLANILQKCLLVSTELSHFGTFQEFAGLYPLILERRQAPRKDSFTFKQKRKEYLVSYHHPSSKVHLHLEPWHVVK